MGWNSAWPMGQEPEKAFSVRKTQKVQIYASKVRGPKRAQVCPASSQRSVNNHRSLPASRFLGVKLLLGTHHLFLGIGRMFPGTLRWFLGTLWLLGTTPPFLGTLERLLGILKIRMNKFPFHI